MWQAKGKTNSQFSWILSLLISALGSLLTGSALAAPIVIKLPHNPWSLEGSREARESLTKCLSKAPGGSILAFILAACSVLESDSQDRKTDFDKRVTKGWHLSWNMKGFRGASCSYLGDSITGSVVKNPVSSGFNHWVWKIPQRRKWLPSPVFLPGKPHGQRMSQTWLSD